MKQNPDFSIYYCVFKKQRCSQFIMIFVFFSQNFVIIFVSYCMMDTRKVFIIKLGMSYAVLR